MVVEIASGALIEKLAALEVRAGLPFETAIDAYWIRRRNEPPSGFGTASFGLRRGSIIKPLFKPVVSKPDFYAFKVKIRQLV